MKVYRSPFAWAWLLLVLAVMVGFSIPLEQWGWREVRSAPAFFILAGPGGLVLVPAASWVVTTFFDGLKDGLQQAVHERELSEAELE